MTWLGHRRGDELLVTVADKLRSLVRTRDVVARLGGDEFIVVARAIDPDEAMLLGERIVLDLTNAMQESGALSGLGLGVSVGYACCPEDGEDGAVLLDLADGGLYAAKAGGKGCCRRHEAQAVQSRASNHVREECFGVLDEFEDEVANAGRSSSA